MSARSDNKFEMTSVRAIRNGTQSRRGARSYRTIDNDLARDNLENDVPAADLQDV